MFGLGAAAAMITGTAKLTEGMSQEERAEFFKLMEYKLTPKPDEENCRDTGLLALAFCFGLLL